MCDAYRLLPFAVLLIVWSRSAGDCQPLTALDFFNANFVPSTTPPIAINSSTFSGDLHLAKHKRRRRGSAVTTEVEKWPNGRVPYVLSVGYSMYQRAVIARAILAYSLRTCIRFMPRKPFDRDYVIIGKIDGCFADFARAGGAQHVSLSDECISYSTVVHELMHVIGFIHEHQRADRDHYVRVLWNNVIPGAIADFDKLPAVGLSSYGEHYDYFSIMHYESTEGTRNGQNTIEAPMHALTALMGRTGDFSSIDLNRINRAYRCSDHAL